MKAVISFLCLAFLSVFTLQTVNAQVIQINQTFSSDTVITPFTGSHPVYSLSISGEVDMLSDSSLIRVVLTDTWGNHYLIFETYPLLANDYTFDTVDASDETRYLDGIICDSLRIDITGALLELDWMTLDTNYIANTVQLQALEKERRIRSRSK